MLTEVLEYINNYFVPIKAEEKTYTVADGMISPVFDDAQDGDRFLICGSRRNDGVYTYHADGIKNDDDTKAAGLRAETFAGTIRAMAVPPAVIALAEEIKGWVEQNSGVLSSPMAHESFNGYSYTLKTGSSKGGGNGALTWRDVFGTRLERWRKPCL